jgi:hypothetical protein
MMSLLEDKIRKNRDNLDAAEPSPGHLQRFEHRLDALQGSQPAISRFWSGRAWKVAATFLALVGVALTLYFTSPGELSNSLAANPLPQDIQEVKMYYELEAEKKLEQVQQCAVSPDQAELIRDIARHELLELDSNSEVLENQLRNDQENKRLKNALILNYKTKADLIGDIIKKVCKL